MTDLEQHIRRNLLDPTLAMNGLQDAGMVSDNCVTARDVAKSDEQRAILWLELNSPAEGGKSRSVGN